MRKKLGLSNELNILVLGLMTLLVIILTVVSVQGTYKMLIKSNKEIEYAHTERMVEQSRNIYNEGWLAANALSKEISQLMREPGSDREREDLRLAIEHLLESSNNLYGMGVVMEPDAFDGRDSEFAGTRYHDKTGRVAYYGVYKDEKLEITHIDAEEENYQEAEWYSVALKEEKPHLAQPYLEKAAGTETMIATVSVPIMSNGRTVGVAMADLNVEALHDILDAESVPEDYAVMMTMEGTVLAHGEDETMLLKDARELSSEYIGILEGAESEGPFDMVKQTVGTDRKAIFVYFPIEFEGVEQMWLCINVVEYDYFLHDAKALVFSMIILSLIVMVVFGAILYTVLNGMLVQPIRLVTQLAEKQSHLDFRPLEKGKGSASKRIKQMLTRGDEIGDMSRAMERMEHSITDFLVNISDKSNLLAATAEELTATSQQAATTANEMRDVVENIAQGASAQAEDTQAATQSVDRVNEVVDRNYEIVKRLAQAADEIESRGSEGRESVLSLQKQTDISSHIAVQVNDIVRDTHESTIKIQKASEMIQSVSDQTNLLALNAAIEAARAGESGRGFAVVAEEIRKLAEQSAGFTEEISMIISELQEKAGQAVTMMDQVREVVEKQNGYAHSTKEKFDMIAESVATTTQVSEELEDSFGILLGHSKEVGRMTENLSAIAQENAATSEEVASQIEQQTQAVGDISRASEGLAEIAMELQTEVSRFKM